MIKENFDVSFIKRISKAENEDDIKKLDSFNYICSKTDSSMKFIYTLDGDFQCLNRLKKLTLENNRISKIGDVFNSFSNLRLLNLKNNMITDLDSILLLAQLEELNLEGNSLERIPSDIKAMKSLSCLKLAHNKLTHVASIRSLAPLELLSSITIKGNPFCGNPNFDKFLLYQVRSIEIVDEVKLNESFRRDAIASFEKREIEELQPREVIVKNDDTLILKLNQEFQAKEASLLLLQSQLSKDLENARNDSLSLAKQSKEVEAKLQQDLLSVKNLLSEKELNEKKINRKVLIKESSDESFMSSCFQERHTLHLIIISKVVQYRDLKLEASHLNDILSTQKLSLHSITSPTRKYFDRNIESPRKGSKIALELRVSELEEQINKKIDAMKEKNEEIKENILLLHNIEEKIILIGEKMTHPLDLSTNSDVSLYPISFYQVLSILKDLNFTLVLNENFYTEHINNLPPTQKNNISKPLKRDSPLWEYIDENGVTQGPFSSSQMLEWHLSGYFNDSLMLRTKSNDEENNPFSPLISYPFTVFGGKARGESNESFVDLKNYSSSTEDDSLSYSNHLTGTSSKKFQPNNMMINKLTPVKREDSTFEVEKENIINETKKAKNLLSSLKSEILLKGEEKRKINTEVESLNSLKYSLSAEIHRLKEEIEDSIQSSAQLADFNLKQGKVKESIASDCESGIRNLNKVNHDILQLSNKCKELSEILQTQKELKEKLTLETREMSENLNKLNNSHCLLIQDFNEEIKELENERYVVSKELSENKENASRQLHLYKSLESDIIQLKLNKESLSREKSSLLQDFDVTKKSKTDLEEEFSSLNKKFLLLQNENVNLEKTMKEYKDYHNKLDNLKEEERSVRRERDYLIEVKESLEVEIKGLQSDKGSLSMSRKQLIDEINELSSQQSKLSLNQYEMDEAINKKKIALQELELLLVKKESVKNNSIVESKNLKIEDEKLKNDMKDLDMAIKRMKDVLSKLEREKKMVQLENENVKASINSNIVILNDVEDRLKKLEFAIENESQRRDNLILENENLVIEIKGNNSKNNEIKIALENEMAQYNSAVKQLQQINNLLRTGERDKLALIEIQNSLSKYKSKCEQEEEKLKTAQQQHNVLHAKMNRLKKESMDTSEQISKLKTEKMKLEGDFDNKQREQEELKGAIDNQKRVIENLREEVEKEQKLLYDEKKKRNQLSNENNNLIEQNNRLSNQVSSSKISMDEIERNIQNLSKRKQTMEFEASILNKEMEENRVKGEMAIQSVSLYRKTESELIVKTNNMEMQLLETQRKSSNLESMYQIELSKQKDNLNSKLSFLNIKITETTALISSMNQEKELISNDIDKLKSSKSLLTSNVSEIENEINSKTKDLKRLEEQLLTITNQLTFNQTSVQEARASILNGNKEIEKLNSELSSTKEEVRSIKNQLSSEKIKLNQVENEVLEKREQHSILSKEHVDLTHNIQKLKAIQETIIEAVHKVEICEYNGGEFSTHYRQRCDEMQMDLMQLQKLLLASFQDTVIDDNEKFNYDPNKNNVSKEWINSLDSQFSINSKSSSLLLDAIAFLRHELKHKELELEAMKRECISFLSNISLEGKKNILETDSFPNLSSNLKSSISSLQPIINIRSLYQNSLLVLQNGFSSREKSINAQLKLTHNELSNRTKEFSAILESLLIIEDPSPSSDQINSSLKELKRVAQDISKKIQSLFSIRNDKSDIDKKDIIINEQHSQIDLLIQQLQERERENKDVKKAIEALFQDKVYHLTNQIAKKERNENILKLALTSCTNVVDDLKLKIKISEAKLTSLIKISTSSVSSPAHVKPFNHNLSTLSSTYSSPSSNTKINNQYKFFNTRNESNSPLSSVMAGGTSLHLNRNGSLEVDLNSRKMNITPSKDQQGLLNMKLSQSNSLSQTNSVFTKTNTTNDTILNELVPNNNAIVNPSEKDDGKVTKEIIINGEDKEVEMMFEENNEEEEQDDGEDKVMYTFSRAFAIGHSNVENKKRSMSAPPKDHFNNDTLNFSSKLNKSDGHLDELLKKEELKKKEGGNLEKEEEDLKNNEGESLLKEKKIGNETLVKNDVGRRSSSTFQRINSEEVITKIAGNHSFLKNSDNILENRDLRGMSDLSELETDEGSFVFAPFENPKTTDSKSKIPPPSNIKEVEEMNIFRRASAITAEHARLTPTSTSSRRNSVSRTPSPFRDSPADVTNIVEEKSTRRLSSTTESSKFFPTTPKSESEVGKLSSRPPSPLDGKDNTSTPRRSSMPSDISKSNSPLKKGVSSSSSRTSSPFIPPTKETSRTPSPLDKAIAENSKIIRRSTLAGGTSTLIKSSPANTKSLTPTRSPSPLDKAIADNKLMRRSTLNGTVTRSATTTPKSFPTRTLSPLDKAISDTKAIRRSSLIGSPSKSPAITPRSKSASSRTPSPLDKTKTEISSPPNASKVMRRISVPPIETSTSNPSSPKSVTSVEPKSILLSNKISTPRRISSSTTDMSSKSPAVTPKRGGSLFSKQPPVITPRGRQSSNLPDEEFVRNCETIREDKSSRSPSPPNFTTSLKKEVVEGIKVKPSIPKVMGRSTSSSIVESKSIKKVPTTSESQSRRASSFK